MLSAYVEALRLMARNISVCFIFHPAVCVSVLLQQGSWEPAFVAEHQTDLLRPIGARLASEVDPAPLGFPFPSNHFLFGLENLCPVHRDKTQWHLHPYCSKTLPYISNIQSFSLFQVFVSSSRLEYE